MRQHLGLLVVIATTALAGTVAAGCASRIQTIIIDNEGGTEAGSRREDREQRNEREPPARAEPRAPAERANLGHQRDLRYERNLRHAVQTSGTSGGTCPDPTPIDQTQLPWKAPAKSVGACSAAELQALVTYVNNNSSATYAQWKSAGVNNPTCGACIFGLESATTWAPLLEDAAGQLVGLNVGGCIAIASANVNCGKAYQNWFDCRFEACADCPSGDTAALQKCLGGREQGRRRLQQRGPRGRYVCTAQP